MSLLPKNEKIKPPAQLMVSRENYIAFVKISDLYQWTRNTPMVRSQLKPQSAHFFAAVVRSQLFLAILGVSSHAENPLVVKF